MLKIFRCRKTKILKPLDMKTTVECLPLLNENGKIRAI